MKKYLDFPKNSDLYFLSLNEDIGQSFMNELESKMSMFNSYNNKLHFVSMPTFVELIKSMRRYPNPEGFTVEQVQSSQN